MATTSTIHALFKDPRDAEAAVRALRSTRLNPKHVRIVRGGEARIPHFGRNAFVGVVGGVIGLGLVGVAIGIFAAGLIPGLPVWLPGGAIVPLMLGLAGAGTGAVAGLLMSQSMSEPGAMYYQDEAAAGRTLLTMHLPPEAVPEARGILTEHGAFDAAPIDAPVQKAS